MKNRGICLIEYAENDKLTRNEKYIRQLFKYVESNSILVIDKAGNLRRIYCPFRVEVLQDMPPLKKGDIVYVEAVKMTIEIKEVYLIHGRAYYSVAFKVLL